MAGLLDFLNTPAGMGLLSAAAGGMAGARRGTPWNNAGRGLTTGLLGYADAQKAQEAKAKEDQAKQARMSMFKSAMTQPQAAQPAMFGVGGMQGTQDNMGMVASQNRDINALSAMPDMSRPVLPQGNGVETLPMRGAPRPAPQSLMQPRGESVLQMAANQEQAAPEMPAEQLPEQMMQTQAPQAAQAGGFDFGKFAQAAMSDPNAPPEMQELAMKYFASQKAAKAPEAYSLSPGQVRYDENNQVVAEVKSNDKNSALAQLIAEREALPPDSPIRAVYTEAITKATTHQPAASMNNFGSPVAGVDKNGNPVFFQTNKGGGAPSIVEGVAPAPREQKPFTEVENSATGFLGRMQAAEKLLGGLQGAEPTTYTSAAGSVPFIGDYAQQKAMTPKQQQYKQAADDWIRAKLRKESGAAIPPDEMDQEYKVYFPQPGNSREVIAQKAQARRMAEAQLMQSAGAAGVAYQAKDDARYTQERFSKSEMQYIETQKAAGMSDAQIIEGLKRGMGGKKALPKKAVSIPGGWKVREH